MGAKAPPVAAYDAAAKSAAGSCEFKVIDVAAGSQYTRFHEAV